LKAGKSQTFNFTIKSLPSTLPDGTYYLLAEVVDSTGATNVTATTQTVAVAAPFVQPSVSVGAVTPANIAINKSAAVQITSLRTMVTLRPAALTSRSACRQTA
jgi:hypothetical protein